MTAQLAASLKIADASQANQFAEQLHGLIVALIQHLDRETDAMHKGAYGNGLLIDETKAELMFDYRQALADLSANSVAMSRFVPVKLDDLRKLNARFQEALQRNLTAVSTAKAISEQLLSRLASQATASRSPKAYGANGVMNQAAAPTSLAIDRSL